MSNPERADSTWDSRDRARSKFERNHWKVAAFVMAALLGGTIVERQYMEPKVILKYETVLLDSEGDYQVLTRLDGTEIVKATEAFTRSDLERFVAARESYDYDYMNDRAVQVRSMAVGSVAEEYNQIYFVPDAAYKTIQDKVSVMVDVTYVSPTGGDTRTVRFTKTMIAGGRETITHHIATITFEYDQSLELGIRERRKNPLGMQIYYYKVEADLAAAS